MNNIERLTVNADKSYEVIIGDGALQEVTKLISNKVSQLAVIYPKDLKSHSENLLSVLSSLDLKIVPIEVANAEDSKNYQTAISVWDELGKNNFTRNDLIIAIGGGATTDLAGFIGATWLRGVAVVLVPTSLLAMVDAAIGGKTGINTPAGKNLVGVFSSPIGVICDLAFLTSLPKPDLAAGLAEVIKCGFIDDVSILDIFENEFDINQPISLSQLTVLIKKAVTTKAKIVASDFKETSQSDLGREILNYGHTLAHAIEKLEDFKWRHGDAVAVGMVFAAELSHQAGLLSADEVARHRLLISRLGLPTSYNAKSLREVLDVMAIDKKTRGNTLRFVVLKAIGKPTRLEGPSDEILNKAWQKVSER
jgi:3-dehydroquinate synthase